MFPLAWLTRPFMFYGPSKTKDKEFTKIKYHYKIIIEYFLLGKQKLSVNFKSLIIYCVQETCAQSLSHVQLFAAPWTAARQTPLSVEFSRQE